MERVIVGMSGGVDSAVAAYLLQDQGYDVVGVTLRTWTPGYGEENSRCCDIDDAKEICRVIDIPYHICDCARDFHNKVVGPFIDDYICGITPNPCVGCNRDLKWAKMLSEASRLGADYIATGHYASVVKLDNGRYTVKRADHAAKDQTYMLYKLTQEQLAKTLMPLGSVSKEEVRSIAKSCGIPVADKPDSQEICFVPDDDYAGYIEKNYSGTLPGEGDFVDEEGNVLGRHKGIIHYTIGQRKGLGIAFGVPMYVKTIDAVNDRVVLAPDESLFTDTVYIRDINIMSMDVPPTGKKIRCLAKVRYRHEASAASFEITGDGTAKLVFDEKVRAAAPGQSAVMYDENGCVIGGGIICKEEDTYDNR